jgi:acyl-CoA synthetase (AMP-forming)/AMP-acid ligase II
MDHFPSEAPLLPEILALHGKWRNTKTAVICGKESLTWRQFTQSNHQLANGLLARGLNLGDSVAIVMSNGIPMLTTLMACISSGLVSVPINLSVNDDALVNMINDAQAKAVIVTSDQRERLNRICDRLNNPKLLKFCDTPASDWQTLESLQHKQSVDRPTINIPDDAPLNVIYSSGTTGMPKGILATQRGRRDWAYDLAIALRYNGAARTLLSIGLYSNISWVAMLSTLVAGGCLIIEKQFDANAALHKIKQLKITHFAMVPIQFQRLIETLESQPADFDMSSVQALMSCGSPLHADLKQKIFEHFKCGIIELYGLTEGVITTIDPEDSDGRWSSVGKPLIGTDIMIIDDLDHEVAANVSGEIVSRGRITMPGYLNRQDANEEASLDDSSGRRWLRTGDIGYLDDDGFLFIVDRKKDMILSGGQNVFPQDIEAVLIQHTDVNDVAVIGAKSQLWGETPVAIVVTVSPVGEDFAAQLMAWVNPKLGKQQRIADVIMIDELPRNPNGKILKRELRRTLDLPTYHQS